jgi:putative ABC transport system ATP-binding protein
MTTGSPSAATPGGAGGTAASLRGVVHLYPSSDGDVVALRGVDLDVRPGESVALLGPSGAGKSTVLGLLAGNFVASSGQVLVGDEDIGRMSGDRLARLRATQVSLVVQGADNNLLPYATATENLWFAQQGVRHRQGRHDRTPRELLELFGLTAMAERPAGRLSSGQCQQIAVLAGIAPGPRLLLLDEPTSRLGPADRDEVVDLVARISAELGTTVVVVTHDPAVAERMTRTVTIRDGRVGAESRHGIEHVKVGRDGLIHLSVDALEILPPDSLVEIARVGDHVEIRPARTPEAAARDRLPQIDPADHIDPGGPS